MLRSWDVESDRPLEKPVESDTSVATGVVAFSEDRTRAVAGGRDGAVRLWDPATGRPIGPALAGHSREVTSIAYRYDGRQIVSGSDDLTARLWPGPRAWPDEVCAKLTRNMSRKQWGELVSPEIDYVCQCPGLPIPPDDPSSTAAPERCPGQPAQAVFP
jgi:WD40 repeat protein